MTNIEAFELIQKMRNGYKLPAEELELLARFCAGQESKPKKKAEAWIKTALPEKEEKREFLKSVYISNYQACAGDGKRLHFAYQNKIRDQGSEETFLQYKRILNSMRGALSVKSKSFKLSDLVVERYNNDWCYATKPFSDLVFYVSKKYLDEALNGEVDRVMVVDLEKSMIHGINKFGDFIVMLMRVKIDEQSKVL